MVIYMTYGHRHGYIVNILIGEWLLHVASNSYTIKFLLTTKKLLHEYFFNVLRFIADIYIS